MVGGVLPIVFFLHLKRIGRRLPVPRSCMGVMQGGVGGSGVLFWHVAYFFFWLNGLDLSCFKEICLHELLWYFSDFRYDGVRG